MLLAIALAVVVLVAALLAYAATRPDAFRVQRSTVIQAPPEAIYPLLADLRRWSAWSPWERKDPAMRRTFGGAERGVGATYAWAGDKNVGEGRMEIVEATEPSRVVIRLDFLKPFEAHNFADFTLEPRGGGATRVTWGMEGKQPFLIRVMCVFVSMDRMVAKDFESGLAAMKAAAEAGAAPVPSPA
jgi:uncharacterized protein YndB with AHSA1/START domain